MPKFKYKRGLVPISGDPVTNGHIALIEEAKVECELLFVAIMINEAKIDRYMFTLKERMQMAEQALAHIEGVRVISSSGLLVDEFLRLGIDAVFRGVRNETDTAYEDQQKGLNGLILAGFASHVHYIPSCKELEHVSSSQVKGFVEMGIDISRFVPMHVKVALETKIRGHTLIGVTGGIATGKSHVAERLASRLGGVHINVDKLLHDLYAEDCHGAKLVRERIAELLGEDVLVGDTLDRAIMRERLFGSPRAHVLRGQIEQLTTPHVMRLLRGRLSSIKGQPGPVFLEWAQLVEMRMIGFVSNRVIIVTADDYNALLAKRGLTVESILDIAEIQQPPDVKARGVQRKLKADGFGDWMIFENSLDPGKFAESMRRAIAWVQDL